MPPRATKRGGGASASAGAVCKPGCTGCGIDCDPDKTLLCDSCEAEWHIYCLKPKLKALPEGDWFCPSCRERSWSPGDAASEAMHQAWELVRRFTTAPFHRAPHLPTLYSLALRPPKQAPSALAETRPVLEPTTRTNSYSSA